MSLRDNCCREEATDEEVARAAAAANVMEFADTLPEGLGTLMGEMELQLSRGQQQRVAIARALLRPAKVKFCPCSAHCFLTALP
jgi:ATP-binding cassette, subfamily B, bacterial